MIKPKYIRNTMMLLLTVSLIAPQASIASSDPQKITDTILKVDQKAPFHGVLVHDDMYKYLRGEEQRAVDLETELIDSRSKDTPSKYGFFVPLSIGIAVGLIGGTYLINKDSLVAVGIGAISGGIVVWSWR